MEDVSAAFDVFSPAEIARAAGVAVRDIQRLVASGDIRTIDGRFVEGDDAVAAVRGLRMGTTLPGAAPSLFDQAAPDRRDAAVPMAASLLAHALIIGALALLLTADSGGPRAIPVTDTTRLVFLPLPGPGGGGGGGGLRQPATPPAAESRGAAHSRSPLPTTRVIQGPKTPYPPPPAPVPQPASDPVEPPAPVAKPEPSPPVVAPIATVDADTRDRAGALAPIRAAVDSHGPGADGGAGAGSGTGIGAGTGPGVGEGSGGGTGGGPYRPGSGITPPSLVREVKPDYTEEARRRGVIGDVELEIVVRRDGSVGDVRLLRGLGAGLDQRAVDAVRQWRFTPARRFGTPVDVLVEVAVEFMLR